MIKKILLLPILFFLISCGGGWSEFEGALSGKKKTTTDEYLIKKKDPLILPPDYNKLVTKLKKTLGNSNSIEVILNSEEGANPQKTKSPLETRIEEELRKGN